MPSFRKTFDHACQERDWPDGHSCFKLWYFWKPRWSFTEQVRALFGDDTIGGQVDLCNASEFLADQLLCLDLAPLQEGIDRLMWDNAIPFAHIPTGDYLALKPDMDPDNPPVAYLSQERGGYSQIISRSFDQFLLDWEQVHYIGPDISSIFSFLHPYTGYLDPTLSSKAEWDALLSKAMQREPWED